MTPKIIHVEACPGHRLRVGFENGEARLFDVTPYLDRGVFRELRDPAYFQRVRPVWGGVEWPHEQDLSADTLYCSGRQLPGTSPYSCDSELAGQMEAAGEVMREDRDVLRKLAE